MNIDNAIDRMTDDQIDAIWNAICELHNALHDANESLGERFNDALQPYTAEERVSVQLLAESIMKMPLPE